MRGGVRDFVCMRAFVEVEVFFFVEGGAGGGAQVWAAAFLCPSLFASSDHEFEDHLRRLSGFPPLPVGALFPGSPAPKSCLPVSHGSCSETMPLPSALLSVPRHPSPPSPVKGRRGRRGRTPSARRAALHSRFHSLRSLRHFFRLLSTVASSFCFVWLPPSAICLLKNREAARKAKGYINLSFFGISQL